MSLYQIEKSMENQLILNPVENTPKSEFLLPAISQLHGIYNTDKKRKDASKIDTKIQFSGREQITHDIQTVYDMWKSILKLYCFHLHESVYLVDM